MQGREDRSGLLIAVMAAAGGISETSMNFYQTARRNLPEDRHLHLNEIRIFLNPLKPKLL
jgi:hypothetical protein